MKLFVNHEYKFIFAVHGKCASSSIKNFFIKILKNSSIKPSDLIHTHRIELNESTRLQKLGYKVYQFVRNPFTRIVSCYLANL